MHMGAKWIAIVVVVVIVVGAAAGFAAYNMGVQAGLQQAQNIRSQFFADRGLGGGAAGGAAAGGFGGQTGTNRQFNPNNFATGQVKTVNGNTVELSTATEVLKVQLTDQTQIQKTGPGTVSDIQAGERVTVQGARGSDGTFIAQSIQIGGNRGFGGQGGTGGAGGQSGTGGGQGAGGGGQGAGGSGRAGGQGGNGGGGQGAAPASTPQAQSSQ
jgi:hypothetical protein